MLLLVYPTQGSAAILLSDFQDFACQPSAFPLTEYDMVPPRKPNTTTSPSRPWTLYGFPAVFHAAAVMPRAQCDRHFHRTTERGFRFLFIHHSKNAPIFSIAASRPLPFGFDTRRHILCAPCLGLRLEGELRWGNLPHLFSSGGTAHWQLWGNHFPALCYNTEMLAAFSRTMMLEGI